MGYDEKLRVQGLTFYKGQTPHRASQFRGAHRGQIGYVFGNGESRLALDLHQLDGIRFACNAYYRDAGKTQPHVDYLGVVDPVMTEEVFNSGYADEHKTLVNVTSLKNCKRRGTIPEVPPKEIVEWDYNANFGCGTEMIQFAAYTGCNPIYLVGFDGPDPAFRRVNNIYHLTENYSCESPHMLDGSRFQVQWVCRRFKGTSFLQVETVWLDVPTVSFAEAVPLEVPS